MDVTKFPAFEKVESAKRMVADNDYVGARSKLLEAHYQYPSLENLPKMITACDVLCAAELTFSDNEHDWYWILQLSPIASVSHIRLQHKKLVTVLEGIKKEFPGAVAALKLVHNAFFVLSNPPKRLVFDSQRLTSWCNFEPVVSPVSSVDNAGSHSGKGLAQEQDPLGCESSMSRKIDDVNVLGGVDEKCSMLDELDDAANELDGVCSKEVGSVASPLKQMPENEGLTSENTAMLPSLLTGKTLPLLSTTSRHEDEGLYDVEGSSKANDFEVGQIWAACDDEKLPRRYARISSVSTSPFRLVVIWLQPVPETENEEKWCEAGLPVVCGLFNLHGDEESVVDCSIFSFWVSYTANPTYDEFRIHPQEDEIWAIYKDWRPFEWCCNPESRNGAFQIIRILCVKEEECVLVVEPVKSDGSENVCRIDTRECQESFEIPVSCFYRFSHRLPSYESKEIGKDHASCSNFSTTQCFRSLPSLPVSNGSSLKAEWIPGDFMPGQVWAIYDGPDQMPRRYVVVNNLVTNRTVCVNLLEPHPMREEEICWVEENLALGCGVFRVGATLASLPMNKFSHLVNCDRSNKQSFYRIYPRKGEVWAMYRNWNTKWKKNDFDRSHCRIVQITSDFCEQGGVQVSSLEQVPGYKTFFQKQLCDGFALNRAVRRGEMLSFSHRVEAFVVPGIQAHGIPECSWHLEPDALPLVLSN
ncbi:hypothetical protein RND81_11G187200 [Saponaria officinalis]|uniref:DUF3444 domain-containing protein n=1 Tax=Saponaria officinalis TaxID=3572 RepID=A0AAW1HNT2_SAPOF